MDLLAKESTEKLASVTQARCVMRYSFVLVIVICLVGLARLDAQDKDLSRIALLVEMNHLLNDFDDSAYKSFLGFSKKQTASLEDMRTIVRFHVDQVMVKKDEIDDLAAHETRWNNAVVAIRDVQQKLDNTVLPFQMALYRRLQFRSKAGLGKNVVGFSSEVITKELKLTAKQKKLIQEIVDRFKKQSEELNMNLESSLKGKVKASSSRAIGILDGDQRRRYHQKVGDAIPD